MASEATDKKRTNASVFFFPAALPWESHKRGSVGTRNAERQRTTRMISAFRILPSCYTARPPRMSIKYISRDVRQLSNSIFSVINSSDGAPLFQELSKIIKSDKRPGKDYLVVDVRDSDFIGGNIVNCRHLPSNSSSDKLDALVRETKNMPQVIFHCALSQSRWVTNTRLSHTP